MRADLGQQSVGARRVAGRIDEPGERRRKLHGPIIGLTQLPCHALFSRGLVALPSVQPQKETPMTEPFVLRRETQIAAPPATVFAFLTDPEKILSWMGSEVAAEAHSGGLYPPQERRRRGPHGARDVSRGRAGPSARLQFRLGWGRG